MQKSTENTLFVILLMSICLIIMTGCSQEPVYEEIYKTHDTNTYIPTVFVGKNAVKILPKPTLLFGVSGFSVTLLHSEHARIPKTTVQLPELPKPKAAMVLYFKVPRGQGDRLKASGGTAEIIWQGSGRSIGGPVQIEDLTNLIGDSSGDMLYSYEIATTAAYAGSKWQRQTVTVSFTPQDKSIDFPIKVLIECGGVL